MSGTLTEEEFKRQCFDLVSLSDKISDGWEIREDRDDIFIVKKVKLPVTLRDTTNTKPTNEADQTSSQNNTLNTSTCPDSDEDVSADLVTVEDSDPCSLLLPSHLITFEYHVTYSHSYNVPILYFNAWHSTGKLLTVEEVWELAPPCSDRYSYITQIDHPILARPFFELHPCRTEQLMGLVVDRQDRYLVSWLSSVGRDVALSLEMGDGKSRKDMEDELSELFDEITFDQDRGIKGRLWEYFYTNPFVSAGIGMTCFYLFRATKLMGVDNHGFNNALKRRVASQAVTVGFIILGAWALKRKSYEKQIENEVISEIHINDSVSRPLPRTNT